jgi:hypothetical protein
MIMKHTVEMRDMDRDYQMRFILVMYGLYGLMRFTALRSGRFREKLRERNLPLTMTSAADDLPRTFRFTDGTVRWEKGKPDDSAVGLIWASPETGMRIMLKMAMGDPKALMKAVIKGDLKLEGDAMGIKWFLDVVTMLSKMYGKKKKK